MKRSFTALITLVAMARAVAWEIVEKPGFIRVANAKIAVELTSESQQPAAITLLAADANGAWKSICRTSRPDFSKAPAQVSHQRRQHLATTGAGGFREAEVGHTFFPLERLR